MKLVWVLEIHLSSDNTSRHLGGEAVLCQSSAKSVSFPSKSVFFLLHVLQVAEGNFHLKGHSSGKTGSSLLFSFNTDKKIIHLAGFGFNHWP